MTSPPQLRCAYLMGRIDLDGRLHFMLNYPLLDDATVAWYFSRTSSPDSMEYEFLLALRALSEPERCEIVSACFLR